MSKKVIAMIMAAMVSISLAGCGSNKNNNNNSEDTDIVVEENTDTSGKWSKDFTLKDFTETTDDLLVKVEKKTKEYGLEYTEDEVVKDSNDRTVNNKTLAIENDKAEKNRLKSMYFSRMIYGEDLSSGQIKMKILLNFDGENVIKHKDFDLGSTSVAKYSEILTGISNRDFGDINEKILEILNSSDGEGHFSNGIEGLNEDITVTKEYIVYSIETTEYDFKKAEQ